MQIRNKVAVVTGASSGIGAAIAKELSSAGVKLLLTARRGKHLSALAGDIGGDVEIHAADIADPATPSQLLDLAREKFGGVDILINNAGVLEMGPLDDVDIDRLTWTIRVNFESVVRSSCVFGRAFKAKGSGAIINVSSIAAFMTTPGTGVYSGAKAAVESFSSSLRLELASHGVRVGCIAPGSTQTEMLDDLRLKIGVPAEAPSMRPEDIAAAVRFMLEQPEGANIAGLKIYAATEAF